MASPLQNESSCSGGAGSPRPGAPSSVLQYVWSLATTGFHKPLSFAEDRTYPGQTTSHMQR